MDVAKYIGLYLLKNNSVNIHGLGNLELHHKPTVHDDDALVPSSFTIEISSSGPIDDNLANFIANNEQLSISKATNAMREFSLQAKNDLQEGKEVVIPAIGKFKEVNGKTVFLMNPAFQFTAEKIPVVKTGKKLVVDPILGAGYQQSFQRSAPQPIYQHDPYQPQQPNYHQAPPPEDLYEEPPRNKVNWMRVIIALVMLVAIFIGLYLFISYMSGNDGSKTRRVILPPTAAPEVDTTTKASDNLPQDTSIAAMKTTPDGKGLTFDVRVFAFSSIEMARIKMKELQQKGYAETYLDQTADSSFTFVLIPIENISPADTAFVMDSLRRLNPLHPTKVGVYRFR